MVGAIVWSRSATSATVPEDETCQKGDRDFYADRKLLLTTKSDVSRSHQGTVISPRFLFMHELDNATRGLADCIAIRYVTMRTLFHRKNASAISA